MDTRASLARKRRRDIACIRCHSYKIKCSGGQPCRNCHNATKVVVCVYPIKDRKVPVSEQYIQKLEKEVEELRDQAQGSSRASRTPVDTPEPSHPAQTVASEPSAIRNPLVAERPQLVQADYLARPVYLGDASTFAYSMQVHRLINSEQPNSIRSRHRYLKNPILLRMNNSTFQLPERPYATVLIGLVKRFLGDAHHLNLGSRFTARLDSLYKTHVEEPLWICRLFILFALGELYSNGITKPTAEGNIPGTPFFLTAVSLLQDAYEEATVLYVETLFLASLYSDALNRTNSAYNYIGTALRVSLTLGLHRNIRGLPPAEREHRNRVWWTVHYLERLCAMKLGHPMMIRDEDISTALPSWDGLNEEEKADFPPPTFLIAQLGLAKVNGMIARDMYMVSKKEPHPSFLQSVHTIFTRLKRWNDGLPSELKMVASGQPASRPAYSLHLLFNHWVILTTRPVLFLVFQQRIKAQRQGGSSTDTSQHSSIPQMATTLADDCIRAARNVIQIMTQMWTDGFITMFGYTYPLLLYASIIVLMMAMVLHGDVSVDWDRTEIALRLLSSMRDSGNTAAAEFCEQLGSLWKDLGFKEVRSLHHRDVPDNNDNPGLHDQGRDAGQHGDAMRPHHSPPHPDSVTAAHGLVALTDAVGMVSRHGYPLGMGSRPFAATAHDGPAPPPASAFYIQADSPNMAHNFLARDEKQRQQQQEQQHYHHLSSSVPVQHSIATAQVGREDMMVAGFAAGVGGNAVRVVGLEESDLMWANMDFNIDLADMDDGEIGSIPLLWE